MSLRNDEPVFVLFSDMGWTALGARVDDDQANRLRREHFEVVRRAVAEHRGHELNTTGDGVLVLFRSARDALACGQAILDHTPGIGLDVRVGVDAGEPIVEGGDVYGTVVSTASRLCAAARPGQIVVSDLVRSLVGRRGGVRFNALGPLRLNGLADPVVAFGVTLISQPAAPHGAGGRLSAGLLGPLEISRDGERVEPTSPKQRALLIDLLIHRGKTVGRDRLIDDLWGEHPPATAAGVVQNYVSQLRRVLGADVVLTAGQGYSLAVDHLTVDVAEFEAYLDRARDARDAGDAESARQAISDALALWRGEPLADVVFEPFAQAEINRLRELRAVALELQLEAEIVGGRHREAVARLEAAVTEHPLHERLWWLLMLALYRSGRQADALHAYQRARTVLADELGLDPGAELRHLERAILEQRDDLDQLLRTRLVVAARWGTRSSSPLVGRIEEWDVLVRFLDGTAQPEACLLLMVGEAGIGKTRLIEQVQRHVAVRGGSVIAGRGFEAERGRPYGFWVDALRAVELPSLDASTRANLAPLLPEVSDRRVDLEDPNRLYDSVAAVLRLMSQSALLAVVVDDLHWLDEQSVSLLHFALRHLGDRPVRFVAAARSAELCDNDACSRIVQALRRDDRLSELSLAPLATSTIGELTAAIAPGADAIRIAEASGGNPLFALEMARALARGDEPLSSRLDALIGDRLSRLSPEAATLVPWMAAFGRSFNPSVLGLIVDEDSGQLFEALGELERQGVLQPTGEVTYDFSHDLVRAAAYKRISTPRRTMVHTRIGTVLAGLIDADDGLAADAARHADAGGDSETCAKVCVRAAQRCLRLVAYHEAAEHVVLGRRHARRLAPERRVPVELQLIRVLLHPGMRLHDPGELARDLTGLCAEAQRLGLDIELSAGLYLLARAYHWGWGDIPRARALLQRAAHIIESTSGTSIEPLLEGARCLAYLEIDMERTYQLFEQLGALHDLAAVSCQYQWGLGLVRAWAGELDEARAALERAIELATTRGDHWATFECTARLALLELEAGEPESAEPLCELLCSLASKLGEGSERSYAQAITALRALARRESGAEKWLDDSLADLERIDARFLTPDLLGIAAEIEYHAGNRAAASARALRGLQVATEVARPLEGARARAMLACVAAASGALDEAALHLQATASVPGRLPSHVEALLRDAGRLIQSGQEEQGGNQWR